MKRLSLSAGLVACALAVVASATELPQAGQPVRAAAGPADSEAAAALKQDMRKLWTTTSSGRAGTSSAPLRINPMRRPQRIA
jgi:hypothetical protein